MIRKTIAKNSDHYEGGTPVTDELKKYLTDYRVVQPNILKEYLEYILLLDSAKFSRQELTFARAPFPKILAFKSGETRVAAVLPLPIEERN